MVDWIYLIILISAGLIVLSIFTSLIAFRFGAPLLLVFLLVGLGAGEDGLGLQFSDANAAYFIGSLALAIILFDSGFSTTLASFRQAAAPAVVLATLGVLLTAAIVALAAHFLLGIAWLQSFMLGAVVGSTDAAAVFFLLRAGRITLKERVRATLEVESGSNDPMAIFLTVTFLALITGTGATANPLLGVAGGFGVQMGLGLFMGLLGGAVIVFIVNRVDLEGPLYPVMVLACACSLFALTGMLGGSGFLAAYVAGLYSGNRRVRGADGLRRFQAGMTWLAQITMFLVLGLYATPSEFLAAAPGALVLALVLIFVARPVAVWLCLLPFGFRREETAFVGWVGLRGAVSILLAMLPVIAGLPNGQLFFNTVFIVVIISLLVQGWTIRPLARWLRLIVPATIGPVDRVELELPGTANHELIVYHVVDGSPVVRGKRLPRWARPSLVVRDGQSMRLYQAGMLRPGDYVYLFIAPRHAPLLDRLFASPALLDSNDRQFFGVFQVDPGQPMASLAALYELSFDGADGELTIGDYMRRRLGGPPEIGDRVACGNVELIVRDLGEEGGIAAVGIALEADAAHRLPRFLSGREVRDFVRKLLRRGAKDDGRG
ncbi:MAG TPA: potassium/proton antiporter [Devosiaceae bacterium]|nr:potassium/proton antiporter [Devosiaceae bacterium]